MQHDLRFPSAKKFFSSLAWLAIIALLAVVVVNLIANSNLKDFSNIGVNFNQNDIIFLSTFAIIAVVSLIIAQILKLFKHS
ncbi:MULTISPECIES: hypothetical protein [Staphylococcus]|uniref:hypothetical protein n=1 Tax=Staphylococcus TaxID=1279 RepID=UPI0018E4C743|nr:MULTISPECIES: hypothetical protein [Staphylococcus]MBI5972890.1 hypothetical protein [Staphylococcus caledonicus]MCI2947052.1 hypothetical protein [Staphylococcus sp. acrmy]